MSQLLKRLDRVQRAAHTWNALALVIRGALAWIFMYHGAGKLFGFRGQPGLHGTTKFFQHVGIAPAHTMAVLAGIIEFGGGMLLLLGLLTPLAGILLAGDMLIAFKVNFADGLISEKATGGFEINVVLGVLALVIAVLGAGRWSLDARLGIADRRTTLLRDDDVRAGY
jgi:putative oxidoreductase